MKTKILYISYNGMNEPLGASQVLSYLFKLSSEYEFHLVSLEKSEDFENKEKMRNVGEELKSKGINWYPLLYKKDGIGKMLNFFSLLLATRKVKNKQNIKFAHCRSYYPALVAYVLGIKYLFDTRGFAFDESADIGTFDRKGIIFRLLKKIEKKLYQNAVGINKLSHEGKRTILENELFLHGDRIKSISVIPTCVDLKRFEFIQRKYTEIVKIGYVGTATGWYDFDRTLKVLKEMGEQMDYHFTIFNGGQHDYIKSRLEAFNIPMGKVNLEKIAFSEMPKRLAEFDIALFYIHPFFSKRASAATKLGELFASGIPVLTNSGVGDHEYYIKPNAIGEIIDFDHPKHYDFTKIVSALRTFETSVKCREVAEKYFSIEKGVNDYKKLYSQVFR